MSRAVDACEVVELEEQYLTQSSPPSLLVECLVDLCWGRSMVCRMISRVVFPVLDERYVGCG